MKINLPFARSCFPKRAFFVPRQSPFLLSLDDHLSLAKDRTDETEICSVLQLINNSHKKRRLKFLAQKFF